MNKKRLMALFEYTKGYRHLIFFSFLLMGIELILTFIAPLIMSVTIDSVLDTNPLNTPWYFEWIIKLLGGPLYLRENIWLVALTMIAFRLVSGIITFLRAFLNNRSSEGVVKRLRDKFYDHVQRLPFKYHVNAQTGDLIQRATTDIESVRRFVSSMFLELIRTVLLFVVGVFVMCELNVQLTLITLSLSPMLIFCSMYYFKKIQKAYLQLEETEGEMYTIVQENLTGIRVVRAFGRQRYELDKFSAVNERLKDDIIYVDNMFANLWASLDLVSGIQIALVTIFGIVFAVWGRISLGEYTAFLSYVHIFLWPMRSFGRVLSETGRTLIAVGRVEEVLNEEEEDDVKDGVTPPLNGDIVFKDVNFAYDDFPVINKLNMTIPGGKTAAILGGTGSGKSTLVELLQRLYDINSGEISIGGVDINKINKPHLRNRIGIVLQEPFLYSKSIQNNIGIKMKEPDISRIKEAARIAAIHDDIVGFEEGYDTIVGERGVTLSGGQKQRIAIARVLTEDSDILIFDDSLSAVDSKTDAYIRDALSKRREDATTIIISHRITTLMEADCIYVIKEGAIAEQGSHDELLQKDGIYKKTYDIQSAQIEV